MPVPRLDRVGVDQFVACGGPLSLLRVLARPDVTGEQRVHGLKLIPALLAHTSEAHGVWE